MKRLSSTVIFLVILCLLGCTVATPIPSGTVQPTRTATHPPTPTITDRPTFTRVPSRTPRPSLTPTATLVPQPSITPVVVQTFPAAQLALRPNNAGQIQRLAQVGTGQLFDVEWSPDGQYLAAATGSGVYLYGAQTLAELRLIQIDQAATHIAFAPDSSKIAVARGAQLGLWDVTTGRQLVEMQGGIAGGIWTVAVSPNGYVAAIGQIKRGLGDSYPELKVWQSATGKLIRAADLGGGMWTNALDFAPDGTSMIYSSGIRDILTGDILQEVAGHFDAIYSPDGKQVFASNLDYMELGDEEGVIRQDISTGISQPALDGIVCQYLSRTGQHAVCYGSNTAVVFDPATGQTEWEYTHPVEIEDASISPDGAYLAVADINQLRVLAVSTGVEQQVLDYDRFRSVAFGQVQLDGQDQYVAATARWSVGEILVWDLTKGQVIRQFQNETGLITGLAFSPDRRTLASIDEEHFVRLWDVPTGQLTHVYPTIDEWADGPLVFHPGGQVLAANSSQSEIIELDLQTGMINLQGENPTGFIYAYSLPYGWYSYSAQGHLISWDIGNAGINLLNYSTAGTITLPHEYITDVESAIETISLSPNEQYLAAGQSNGEILIWDTTKQQLIRRLTGHTPQSADGWYGAIHHVQFSPQNTLLLSIGWDNTIRLWDIGSGRQLQVINACCTAGFSPDGRLLLLAREGLIDVWGLPSWP